MKKIIYLTLLSLFFQFANAHRVFAIENTSPGDLNSDGKVDILDYNLLVSKFGAPYTIFDFNAIVANYGKTTSKTYGFDPGLTKRLIATFKPDATYYEDCPDSPTGKCKGTLAPGSGFYTLQAHASIHDNHEDVRLKCKTNQTTPFFAESLKGTNNTDGIQRCPHQFNWSTNSNGSLAAKLTTDTLDWSLEQKTTVFTGFQSNIPYGDNYMGGNNHPFINNYSIKFTAKASEIDAPSPINRSSIKVRFLVGTGWWIPSLNKGFVLEMNLDAINVDGQPEWSTNVKYTQNNHFPNNTTTPLYLGGRYWRVPELLDHSTLSNRGEVAYHIDWTKIVKQLIADGDLPAEALGPYPASFYFGPESINPAKATMTVSEIYMLGSSQ